MLELYHGSNLFIDKIDFTKCKPYKDFGQGFYLTDIFPQAMDMAIKRSRIIGSGSPVVTKFLFDEKLLTDGSLKVLTFDSPSIEWAKFIIANRKRDNDKFVHGYDVVVGPVADDGVAFQLERYLNGGDEFRTTCKRVDLQKVESPVFFRYGKSY